MGAFPPDNLDLPRLLPSIGPAHDALARYDGLLSAIPNAHVLLSRCCHPGSRFSSKIEGTRVTMGEVLEFSRPGPTLSRRLSAGTPKKS
jgi:hypothetical protein